MKCWNCGKEIDAADSYCRFCGTGQNSHVSFYYKPAGIVLLVLLIGPFALWFLIRSPVISKTAKWIGSIVIALVSIWFCYSIYTALSNIFSIYSDLLGSNFTIT